MGEISLINTEKNTKLANKNAFLILIGSPEWNPAEMFIELAYLAISSSKSFLYIP